MLIFEGCHQETYFTVWIGAYLFRCPPGQWTATHKGLAADAYKASARGSDVQNWRQQHNLPRSARFDISMYGDEVAAGLARAWRSKLQHLYNAYLCDGACKRAHVSSRREPAEYSSLLASLTGRQLVRAVGIREIEPL